MVVCSYFDSEHLTVAYVTRALRMLFFRHYTHTDMLYRVVYLWVVE